MDKVLIVDDSFLNIKMLIDILSDSYEIVSAHNGLTAIEKAISEQPCLVLMDVVMPGLNGFEVIRSLKKNSLTRDIPVIFVTGLNNARDEEYGLNCGAVDYITKPFNSSVVKARVKTHIELYKYRKAVEEMAMKDVLTGLPNMASFNDRSKLEWARSMRDQSKLTYIFLDIDYFKNYNDFNGLQSGDEVIKSVSNVILKELKRGTDFAARFGGDEFSILLPNTHKEGGMYVAENIRSSVEKLKIPHRHSGGLPIITVSIGGTTVVPVRGRKSIDILEDALRMLDSAKLKGGNRVEWTI